MTRSEARRQVVALVFERSFHDEAMSEIIELAKEARELEPDEYICRSAEGVFSHLEEIDGRLEPYCVGWQLSRIPRVALAIMRVAVYEMLYDEEIPSSVSINEAVELAKRYGSETDPSYINGVLGSVARSLEK